MPTVTNKTQQPLSVPLPHGKRLHLGPGKTAEITSKAIDHPPLQKLVEAGQIEIEGGGRKGVSGAGTEKKGISGSRGFSPGGAGGPRRTGDR